MTADLLERTKAPFRTVIRDAGVTVSEIHHVILVGGSTRMPAVADVVRELTGGKEPETRNHAESLVYSTEKVLADNGDKVPDDVKTQVTAAVTELKTALEGTDIEAVKSKQAALNAVAQKIGEAIYAADAAASAGAAGAAGPGPEQAGPSETASDEDVVDAEIVDEDEKLSLIHISEPTRLGMISYAVF